MVRFGLVGVGFMGMVHYLAAKRPAAAGVARYVALATRDPVRRGGDWRAIQGNFGPRGGIEDLAGVAAYATLEELLADPDIDAVDLCVPTDQHVPMALAALAAGKHVFVEKPISLSLADADALLAAAAAAGRRLLVGHVLPFFPDFAVAAAAIRSGDYGKLLAANLRRHICPPQWSDAFDGVARTGGPIIDLHVHDAHFVAAAIGAPSAVRSVGVVRQGRVDHVETQYIYGAGGPVVTASGGALSAPGRPFTHGYELFFEAATLEYQMGRPPRLYTAEGAHDAKLAGGDEIDAFAAELAEAARAFRDGGPSLLSGESARNALALCLAEQESVLTGAEVPFRPAGD